MLKNLCVQLEYLSIFFELEDTKKRGDERILELLNDLHFPSLQSFSIINFNVRKVTKKFINQFPILRDLAIRECNVEIIEDDAFSNLKQLVYLDLDRNLLATLKKEHFSQLINLKWLAVRDNRLEFIDNNAFSNLKHLRRLELCDNKLSEVDKQSLIDTINIIEIFV